MREGEGGGGEAGWRRRIADGGLKRSERAPELSKILCEECLGRIGGDQLQRRQAQRSSEAPREHGDVVTLDESRRSDGPPVLTIGEEQRDLSRVHACMVGEELPRHEETAGDRSEPRRRHLVDPRVDLGRVVREIHAKRSQVVEGHHTEARRVVAEGVVAHLVVGRKVKAWIQAQARASGSRA